MTGETLPPDVVADEVVNAVRADRFWILPQAHYADQAIELAESRKAGQSPCPAPRSLLKVCTDPLRTTSPSGPFSDYSKRANTSWKASNWPPEADDGTRIGVFRPVSYQACRPSRTSSAEP